MIVGRDSALGTCLAAQKGDSSSGKRKKFNKLKPYNCVRVISNKLPSRYAKPQDKGQWGPSDPKWAPSGAPSLWYAGRHTS